MKTKFSEAYKGLVEYFYSLLPRPFDIEVIKKRLIKDSIDTDSLLSVAKVNKTQAIVADSLIKCDLANDYCKELYFKNFDRMTGIYKEIKLFIEYVNRCSIDIIVLENGGLYLLSIVDQGLFEFGDIDILVKSKDFISFTESLVNNGYQTECDYREVKPDTGERIVLKSTNGCLRINIQSTLIAHEISCPVKYKPYDELFNNRTIISEPHVGVLADEDILMQLCIHSKSHSLVKMPGVQLQTDIDWFIRNKKPDWEKITNTIIQYKLKRCCYFALRTPAALLNTPIPVNVLDKIKQDPVRVLIWKLIVLPNVAYRSRLQNLFAATFAMILMSENMGDMSGILFPDKNWLERKYGKKLPIVSHYVKIAGLVFGSKNKSR